MPKFQCGQGRAKGPAFSGPGSLCPREPLSGVSYRTLATIRCELSHISDANKNCPESKCGAAIAQAGSALSADPVQVHRDPGSQPPSAPPGDSSLSAPSRGEPR